MNCSVSYASVACQSYVSTATTNTIVLNRINNPQFTAGKKVFFFFFNNFKDVFSKIVSDSALSLNSSDLIVGWQFPSYYNSSLSLIRTIP